VAANSDHFFRQNRCSLVSKSSAPARRPARIWLPARLCPLINQPLDDQNRRKLGTAAGLLAFAYDWSQKPCSGRRLAAGVCDRGKVCGGELEECRGTLEGLADAVTCELGLLGAIPGHLPRHTAW
jgi:hypothetical protein